MIDHEFFCDPDRFLASDDSDRRKLVRTLGANLLQRLGPSRIREVELLTDLARSTEDHCCIELARHLEIQRLRLAGKLVEASRMFYQAPRGRCPYCDANLMLLGISIGNAQTYAQGRDFAPMIRHNESGVSILASMSQSAAQRGDKGLAAVLTCVQGLARIHLGMAVGLNGESERALQEFKSAMADTKAPAGGRIHAYRWWGRLVPCMGLPTAELRDYYNETAFVNYSMQLSFVSDPKQRKRAKALLKDLLKRNLTPIRAGRIQWMLGALMIDDWVAAKGKRKAMQSAREASERHFRQALVTLIDHEAPPADIVACICDRARLPWQRDPGRVLLSILKHDPRYSPEKVASYVRALDPSLYQALMKAAEAGHGRETLAVLGQIRDRVAQRRAWPSFLPKAA